MCKSIWLYWFPNSYKISEAIGARPLKNKKRRVSLKPRSTIPKVEKSNKLIQNINSSLKINNIGGNNRVKQIKSSSRSLKQYTFTRYGLLQSSDNLSSVSIKSRFKQYQLMNNSVDQSSASVTYQSNNPYSTPRDISGKDNMNNCRTNTATESKLECSFPFLPTFSPISHKYGLDHKRKFKYFE